MNNMNLPNPETRHEAFLASAAGMNVSKPKPITREEIYLNAITSGSGGDFDPDSYYTKPQTDARITEKVAEIVADAPEDFDTLKEMSDWISQHEESAAAMNTAIQRKVDKVAGKGLSTNDYTTEEKTKLAGIPANASDVGQLYPDSNHGEIFNNYQNSARPNVASGESSHAEGGDNTSSGAYSHTEGAGNTASGNFSHAEGGNNTASNGYSHAEGYNTIASGGYSHAEGEYTIAASDTQHVQGRCNVADTNGKFAFIIGNGTHWDRRSNAFAVDWNGLIYQNNSATGIDLFSLSSTVDNKVDKVSGKSLSTNDYTNADKTKLSGIEEGATKTIVDTNLSSTSTNPVQNKIINSALANYIPLSGSSEIAGNLIPITSKNIDFGSSDKYWNKAYVTKIIIGSYSMNIRTYDCDTAIDSGHYIFYGSGKTSNLPSTAGDSEFGILVVYRSGEYCIQIVYMLGKKTAHIRYTNNVSSNPFTSWVQIFSFSS